MYMLRCLECGLDYLPLVRGNFIPQQQIFLYMPSTLYTLLLFFFIVVSITIPFYR